MDHDGGDALDMAELKGALEVMQISVSELECAALFDRLDADKSGTIDKDELLRFIRLDNNKSEDISRSGKGRVAVAVSVANNERNRIKSGTSRHRRSSSGKNNFRKI